MKARTSREEIRYNQALGYAWGIHDGAHGKRPIGQVPWRVDSLAFADWYAAGSTGSLQHSFLALVTFHWRTKGKRGISTRNCRPYPSDNARRVQLSGAAFYCKVSHRLTVSKGNAMTDITEYAIEVNGKVIDVAFRDKDKAREFKQEWLQFADPPTPTVTIVHRRVRYFEWHPTTD